MNVKGKKKDKKARRNTLQPKKLQLDAISLDSISERAESEVSVFDKAPEIFNDQIDSSQQSSKQESVP